jgi:hypothetical protein
MPHALADPSDVYRRAARRLRSRHAGRPATLYRSLRDLSDRYDQTYPVPGETGRCPKWVGEAPAGPSIPGKARLGRSLALAKRGDSSPAEQFGRLVTGRLQNGILRYSARGQLLVAADGMGIGRFQANLIIAAVQHRAEPPPHEPLSARRILNPLALALIVLVQALIALTAWGVWFR